MTKALPPEAEGSRVTMEAETGEMHFEDGVGTLSQECRQLSKSKETDSPLRLQKKSAELI